MEDILKILVGLFVGAIALIALLLGLALILYPLNESNCKHHWQDSGLNYDYSFWGDCRIQVKGKWIPADSYRHIK